MANEQEQLRDAIERDIHTMLEAGGSWIAVLDDGREVGFRPAGKFAVLLENRDGEEVVYSFRVRVESVPTD